MMRIFSNDDGGLFGVCMGAEQIKEPSELDLEALAAMQDAEDAFERAMEHATRATRRPDEAEEILASLIGAWQCVTRARAAAGY